MIDLTKEGLEGRKVDVVLIFPYMTFTGLTERISQLIKGNYLSLESAKSCMEDAEKLLIKHGGDKILSRIEMKVRIKAHNLKRVNLKDPIFDGCSIREV